MSQERQMSQQVKELNLLVRTYLAPSTIHGVGLFALREVKQGESLYTDMGPRFFDLTYDNFADLLPEVREHLLGQWPQVVNGSKFAYPTTRLQAYLNHSDTPNYDAVNDVALADIPAGTEITEDYRKIEGWEQVFTFIKA